MASLERKIDKAAAGSGKEIIASKLNTRRDCGVDVNDDDIRSPFSLLDGQILYEILARLPVKSLLQVKRVCKHWCSVVRDPYFVGLHFTRSKAFPKLSIFVSRIIGNFLFSVDLCKGGVLLDQMKVFEDQPVGVLNPVNGLVCFKRTFHWGTVLIYNPSTGDETSWIESGVLRGLPFYGFGFDSKTKVHKVVCLWQSYGDGYEIGVDDVCEVLTVGQNAWRKIDDIPPYKAFGESVHVNGVVYWLSTYNYRGSKMSADAKYIVAFDIGSEKFRVIPIPGFIADCRQSSVTFTNHHDLLVIDGCVGLLDRTFIIDGDGKDAIKVWIFHNEAEGSTASNWTHETILVPVEWDQKWTKCSRSIGGVRCKPCSELLFQAITGTELIIMMPRQYEQLGGVFSLYCYDRKKKTLNLVEISTVCNGKGFLINEPVYHIDCGTFVESLYPVQ